MNNSNVDSNALVQLLTLERLDDNLFRGENAATGWNRIYGGQVLAQALQAACCTIDESSPAHSLHAYFLRPGDPNIPLIFDVDRIRDGRSFATRRIRAIQHGNAILNMSVSFQRDEPGHEHQVAMPDVPPPEDVPERQRQWAELSDAAAAGLDPHTISHHPIEIRPVNPWNLDEETAPLAPRQLVWVRVPGPLQVNAAMQQCLLAYASDETLMDTALMPHAGTVTWQNMMGLSLDHAMWFHHPLRVDEWLLYVQDSPASYRSRGLNFGSFFTRDGKLVATAVQEGLMRPIDPNVTRKRD